MRPSFLHRLGVALVAATFLVGGAEHWFGLETCPHHDAAFVGHGTAGAESSEQHAHHGAPSEAPDSDSAEHGPCDCIGPCASPSPTALPVAASFAIAAGVERVETSVSSPRDFVSPQLVPFLLPYAHAPPSLG